jgi:MFS family permease
VAVETRPATSTRATSHRTYVSLGVTCITLAIAYGVWYAYSVFLVALLREFGWTRSVLGGAFSVFTLVNGAANSVLGWLVDRLGPRRLVVAGGAILAAGLWADSLIQTPAQLYLAFGVLTAVGVATAGWTPAVLLVQRDFPDRLGLALGIAGAGIGLGISGVVPLCQALIDALGWRSAFRVLSLVAAVWIIPVTWWVVAEGPAGPRPPLDPAATPGGPDQRRPPRATGAITLAMALATVGFWMIAIAKFLGNIGTQALHVHQAAYLVDHGSTPRLAATVVSVVGAASMVGKIGGGWLSDVLRREVVYVLGMASVIAGIGVLGLVATQPFVLLAYLYAVLFGLGYAVTASLVPAMMSDRFRGPHFGAIFGVGQVGSAIGSALGAWLAGRIFDATGSYAIAFTAAAVATAAAAGCAWIIRLPPRTSPPVNP